MSAPASSPGWRRALPLRSEPGTAEELITNAAHPPTLPNRATRRRMLKGAGALGDRGYDSRRTKAARRRATK
jgi:hypothetical protein